MSEELNPITEWKIRMGFEYDEPLRYWRNDLRVGQIVVAAEDIHSWTKGDWVIPEGTRGKVIVSGIYEHRWWVQFNGVEHKKCVIYEPDMAEITEDGIILETNIVPLEVWENRYHSRETWVEPTPPLNDPSMYERTLL